MTEQKPNPDLFTRVIVLIYGVLESGQPCWIYAAVKPSKYQPFLAAQKDGTLDIYQFAPYGEIIVSGEGKSPPDEITLKVAQMYQTDPAKLYKADEIEREIKKRTEKKE